MDRGTVFVVGAGPAGLYASRKIAAAGYQVIILNRDIKPGGLAEYGIYPQKFHMKGGLRKQFFKFLEMPNLHYFGNVSVGNTAALTIGDLRQWNPSALVFASGAQGTKKLGLPGEDSKGLYSAKDYVFNYNQLPPFTSRDFSSGRRVAIVGMGNVMVDIARWLLQDMPGQKPEEVVVVARRGPFEVKFDEKEFDHIEMHLDRQQLQDELRRVEERIRACDQDIAKVPDTSFPWLKTPPSRQADGRLSFRFLSSPAEVIPDATGRIAKLRIVENLLVRKGDTTAAKATDKTTDVDFDTLIFAIGDVVDPSLGLPYDKGSYVTNPDPSDPDRAAYEVFEAQTGKVLEGHFVVGWARKASDGLVGKARFDAERGCDHILKYLEAAAKKVAPGVEEIVGVFERKGFRHIDKEAVKLLAHAEEAQAKAHNLPAFKFPTNEEMLAAIEKEKAGKSTVNGTAAA
ncbi:MAG: FAD-dependent oxidoreductase [Terriglobia bacterium]